MEYGVLGSVLVRAGDRTIAVPAGRPTHMLALLVLHPGQRISVDRLIAELWAGDPPATAREQVYNGISGLRRALGDATIRTVDGGYQLHADPAAVDAQAFESAVTTATDLAGNGRPAEASRKLRTALGYWRGPALEGLAGPVVETEAHRLSELRAQAIEILAESALATGDHARVAAEMPAWVSEHPFRERLVGAQMLALYRTGRQDAALEAYTRLATRLTDELGVDPTPELQRLRVAILRAEVSLDPRAAVATGPVPAQLPPAPSGFTGRTSTLDALDTWHAGGHAPIVLITGTAGVGKTALALTWAHQVRTQFPDGQLYADLAGYGPDAPARPLDVLARMLRAYGVAADQVPVELEEASALFRTITTDRRVLIVLDNARSSQQVRPLLAAGHRVRTIVTSRDSLRGLVVHDGAEPLTLPVLEPDEAHALLAAVLGGHRLDADPVAAHALVAACARLPLALRIAAAHLRHEPTTPLSAYVNALADHDPLSVLDIPDEPAAGVRAAFDHSYQTLPDDIRHVFTLLSLVPGPDADTPTLAALAALAVPEVRTVLDRLADAHLVEGRVHGGDHRWSQHDLLRRFAAQYAGDEPAATRRLYDHYRDGVRQAARLLYPHIGRLPDPDAVATIITTAEDARDWLAAQLPSLVAAVTAAAGHGLAGHATTISDGLRGYFLQSRYDTDWSAVANAAVAVAHATADRVGEAAAHLSLGNLAQFHGDTPAAGDHLRQALDLAESAGWSGGVGAASNGLGNMALFAGDLTAAAGFYARAVDAACRGNLPQSHASVLTNLALVQAERGRVSEAIALLDEALDVLDRVGQADVLRAGTIGNRGIQHLTRGHLDRAQHDLHEALTIATELGSHDIVASTHDSLARLCLDRGDPAAALPHARIAVDDSAGTSHRRSERAARITLAIVWHALGRTDDALTEIDDALLAARAADDAHSEVQALTARARFLAAADRYTEARPSVREALARADRAGYAVLRAQAHIVASEIEAATGHPDAAADHARRAAGSEHAASAAAAASLLVALGKPPLGSGADPSEDGSVT